jgi:hypothetical protein
MTVEKLIAEDMVVEHMMAALALALLLALAACLVEYSVA